jgi:hypothetical protein
LNPITVYTAKGYLPRGDLLICGMRLDTIMRYVHEIRQRGEYTVERALEDFAEIQHLKARIRELEALLAGGDAS